MKRVLIASARDWVGVGRLPSTLSGSQLDIDLFDRGGTQASASSHIGKHIKATGSDRDLAVQLLEVADAYDRVIVCDDPLLLELLAIDDPRVDPMLPAPRDSLATLLDKTRFSEAAEKAAICVPEWRLATSPAEAALIALEFGGRVVVKGARGHAGLVVRAVDTPADAHESARLLGGNVLVERFVNGHLGMMPCLFENGRLVTALAAGKRRTLGPHGPSSVNQMWDVTPGLLETAEKAGEAFGLDGFASIDLFAAGDEKPVVLEINPRPVPQLHIARRTGVDLGGLFADILHGRVPTQPHLPRRTPHAVLFPQELQRRREAHGVTLGTLLWAFTPGALSDVPWEDPGLLRTYAFGAR